MTREWLRSGVFKDDPNADLKATRIIQELGDRAITKSHSRHILPGAAQNLGLNILPLESDQSLQDAVLSVHHATILTMSMTPAVKII